MPFDPTAYKLLSLDIYGTLINAEKGIYDALVERLDVGELEVRLGASSAADLRRSLLQMYVTEERKLQKNFPGFPYPQIVREIYVLISERLELECDIDKAGSFATTICDWPAYSDTVQAVKTLGKYYKIVALANVDEANLAGTMRGPLYGLTFDASYTAEAIESFKPDVQNFEYLVDHVNKDFMVKQHEILHVATRLRQDHVPAKKAGLSPGIWIERRGERGAFNGDAAKLMEGGKVEFGAQYKTLLEFAQAAEKAFKQNASRAPSVASGPSATSGNWL